MNESMIGKTVEWMTIDIGLESSHIAGGRGIVHSIAYEGGDDTWQDFIALVELPDGDLVKVPVTVAQMSVSRRPVPPTVDIVFDGPPSHESGRFIEVEDSDGNSIKFGEWLKRPDGYWVLRVSPGTEACSETIRLRAIHKANP